ncbi:MULTISPECIES: phosphopantetheine-binding protein [Paenibacillus]|uniref:Acyl carrier protein n=1 Tax=Paenibacillus azoreducens TaxID=116718 RepID=A0A919YGH7_9BACL|nr:MULTISPECIES: phosphopantetheine-binding protein [Paenibacillus]MBE9915096.1 acyl carrier protein [Paenibacillus donghaensis]GIO49208.1 acyl carrier protein [Paenibacillus azoreducens]
MNNVNERCKEVLDMLIDALGLEDVDKDNVNYDAPLFLSQDTKNEGLGLDSVDALEIVVALRSKYNLKLKDEDKGAMRSISTLAAFIDSHVNQTVV